MLEGLWTLENLVALITLAGLEIVLGIDNIVFVVVVTNKLPEHARAGARRLGIGLAMFTPHRPAARHFRHNGTHRPPSSPPGAMSCPGRDIVLLSGGLFLLAKATHEIHDKLEEPGKHESQTKQHYSYLSALLQIVLLDAVFSLDSVITAVGMAQHLTVMISAIVIAVLVMLLFAGPVSEFVSNHPTVQMLAFSFLLLVGIFLMAEGMHKHIDRGYIYFAHGLLPVRRIPEPAYEKKKRTHYSLMRGMPPAAPRRRGVSDGLRPRALGIPWAHARVRAGEGGECALAGGLVG